jgi:hypothetical protein
VRLFDFLRRRRQRESALGQAEHELGTFATPEGTGLREEILGIMRRHGLDSEGDASMNVNAGDYGDMQKQIMEALSKHGVNIDGGGVQIDPSAEDK